MKNFIFDRYGYYVEEGSKFSYQGFTFSLELNPYTKEECEDMNNFVIHLSSSLFNKKAYIVPSREDNLITISEYGNVSLIAVEDFKVSMNDMILFHQSNTSKNKIKLSQIKNLWRNKLALIEERIIPSLKVEEYYYQLFIICITHAIGEGINAVQYLQDMIIDFDNELSKITLVHKRASLTSFSLLNPFNLIIDSPMRDLAELYKNDEINFDELVELLKRYQVDVKEVTYLLARILFPTNFFDLLEEHYQKRDSILEDINSYYENIDYQTSKIKKIHSYLVHNYGIRKINWLE